MDNIFLLTWDHKHGADHSIHKTFDGAYAQAIKWMRDVAEEWHEDSCHEMSDDELYNSWTGLSGETEFFSIEKMSLKG